MATVNFRIRSKANKNVSIKIYVSLSRGNMIETNTGFTVHPKDWSSATNRPKNNTAENKLTFNSLKKLETFIYDEFNKAQSNSVLVDDNWLDTKIDECFERVKKADTGLLTNHVQYIIDNSNTRKISGSNKIGLSERRVLGYKSFLNIIFEYQKVIKKKILFLDINKAFTENFTNWLINNKEYSVNYSGKQIDNLKTVCTDAKSLGIKTNPYLKNIKGFKESSQKRYIITLSFNEIDRIRVADIKREALKNTRKWLLIGCEIGQRVGDLLRIAKDDIRYKEGRMYIDIIQEKTGKSVTVRVGSPHIIDIIENDFPYKISSQKLNEYVKILCKESGIIELTEGKKFDKESKRRKFGIYPKYDLIASHCFRRSFATNYYKKIPTPILMNITGHSRESDFLYYINERLDKDENADLFMSYYEGIHKDRKPFLQVVKSASE